MIRVGRYHASVECGQRLWYLRSWSPRRYNWETRKWEYRWVHERSGFIRWWGGTGEKGFAVGPLMFWKERKRVYDRV